MNRNVMASQPVEKGLKAMKGMQSHVHPAETPEETHTDGL